MAPEINRVSLDPKSFADAIKMILKHFLKMKTGRKLSGGKGSLVIDIELLAERNSYIVQITHCGRWTDKGVDNLFNEFCMMVKNGLLPNSEALANVFQRSEGQDDEDAYEIKLGEGNLVKMKTTLKNELVHFPSFKNYVLIKLRYALSKLDLSEFKEIIIRELNALKKSHRDVKITFYFGQDVFCTNHVESDEDFQDSQSLSFPLTDVIRQSMNTKFKERCLKTLGVQSAHDARKVLARTLFSMTHENYMAQ